MLTVAVTCSFEAFFTVTYILAAGVTEYFSAVVVSFVKKKVKHLLAFCPKTRT